MSFSGKCMANEDRAHRPYETGRSKPDKDGNVIVYLRCECGALDQGTDRA